MSSSILYIHMAALGDGLMASPGLALLKQALPERQLVVLSREHVVSYFKRLSFVDKVEMFGSNRYLQRSKPWLSIGVMPEVLQLLERLRNGNYEAGLQWRGQFIDTLLNVATGAPYRLAARQFIHRRPVWPVEHIPGTAIEIVEATGPNIHLVEAMAAPCLRLIEKLTGRSVDTRSIDWRLRFPLHASEVSRAEAFLSEWGLTLGRFAVLSISSKTTHNQWPVERFAAVARHMQERHGLDVLVDALPHDRSKALAIIAGLPRRAVAPEGTGLGEAAVVIARARLLVCFNSAPMHIASALGTPVVVIGGRDGADIAPWRVPNRVVTGNEFYPRRHPDPSLWPELTRRVQAAEVIRATDELMNETTIS